jgi:hypothetical protein
LARGSEEEQFEEKFYSNLPIGEINALITMVAFLATMGSGLNFVEYSGHLLVKLNSTYGTTNPAGIEENIPVPHAPTTSANVLQPVSVY